MSFLDIAIDEKRHGARSGHWYLLQSTRGASR